jgi:hypothetical protein
LNPDSLFSQLQNYILGAGPPFWSETPRNVKTFFLTVFAVLTEGNEGNEGLVFEAQIEPLFSLLPSVRVFLRASSI